MIHFTLGDRGDHRFLHIGCREMTNDCGFMSGAIQIIGKSKQRDQLLDGYDDFR